MNNNNDLNSQPLPVVPNTTNGNQSIDNDYDDWANVPFERLM